MRLLDLCREAVCGVRLLAWRRERAAIGSFWSLHDDLDWLRTCMCLCAGGGFLVVVVVVVVGGEGNEIEMFCMVCFRMWCVVRIVMDGIVPFVLRAEIMNW